MSNTIQPAFREGCSLLMLFILLATTAPFAQQRVSGLITGANGTGVSGVTIQVLSKTVHFINSVGFAIREVNMEGRNQFTATLIRSEQRPGEAVVTAPGIRNDAKRSGNATSTVRTEQTTSNRTLNDNSQELSGGQLLHT